MSDSILILSQQSENHLTIKHRRLRKPQAGVVLVGLGSPASKPKQFRASEVQGLTGLGFRLFGFRQG